MKTQKEIKEKYNELTTRLESITPWDSSLIASTDGQRYILKWVLDQDD